MSIVTVNRVAKMIGALLLALVLIPAVPAWSAEHPALIRARTLYNAGSLDEAISAAGLSRLDAESVDASGLVIARAHLERYRLRADPADLASARENLAVVRTASLSPRDQLDLLVGLGQSLYFGELFGAAAELFDTALRRAEALGERDRRLLLDWWATAIDRQARFQPFDRREELFGRLLGRMAEELRDDPGSAPANYWLAAAARGAGDADRAWDAAVAGWVRAYLRPETSERLRADLDQLVTEALIQERVLTQSEEEQGELFTVLSAQWTLVKDQWR